MTLKILELRAENYKRLKAVTIRPDGDVVLIGGRNKQGKSSILDAIFDALRGASRQVKSRETRQAVRDGQDVGWVRLEIGEPGDVKYIVTRRWTADDSAGSLTVQSGDGAKYSSPQKLLDELVGNISFDPLAFLRQDAKQQVATLVDAMGDSLGFDPIKLEAERKAVYERRTEISREVKKLEGQLAGYPPVDYHVPDEEVSAAEILAEAQAASEANARLDDGARMLERAQSAREQAEQRYAEAERALKAARMAEADGLAAFKRLPARVDLDSIRARLDTVEQINVKVRQQRDRAAVAAELSDRKQDVAQHTAKLQLIEKQKQDGIAAAKLPVVGLSFDENGVTYNGVPFSQASDAESKSEVAAALAIAANPKLRVMRIDNGEALDSASLKALTALAEANDYQVWISRVDESGTVGFTIEDGEVA